MPAPCPICKDMPGPIDIRPALGERLKQIRDLNSWSQEELAHRLGIRREQLSRYERGVNDILLSTFYTWAKRLNMAPEKLLPKLSS